MIVGIILGAIAFGLGAPVPLALVIAVGWTVLAFVMSPRMPRHETMMEPTDRELKSAMAGGADPSQPPDRPVPISIPPSKSGRDDPLEELATARLILWDPQKRQATFEPRFHAALLAEGPAAILRGKALVGGPAGAMLTVLAAHDRWTDPVVMIFTVNQYEKNPEFRNRVDSGQMTASDLTRLMENSESAARADGP